MVEGESMSCSLKIKYADAEIEFTGEEAVAEKHLLPLVQALSKAFENSDHGTVRKTVKPDNGGGSSDPASTVLTTSTAATKLVSKTGTGLVTAAAYVLHTRGKDTVSRNELTQEMKGAKSYFKESYLKNLSNSIGTLVKNGTLLDQGNDTYALSVSSKGDLDKKFAK
jgi:hypothetical protein